MIRWTYSAGLLALLAAVVGAQGPPPKPTAAQQARLFQENRALIKQLISSSLDLTKQQDPLERVGSTNFVVRQLATEIGTAAKVGDNHRVSELGRHLDQLLNNGIMPNLSSARERIAPGSQEEKRIHQRHTETTDALDSIERTLKSNFGDNGPDNVTQLLNTLSQTRKRLSESVEPEDRQLHHDRESE